MSAAATSRILVVDDDVQVLQSTKRILERQGYLVEVHDGGPGCSTVALRSKPDLVLVDVKMPFLTGDVLVSLFDKHSAAARPILVLFSAIDELRLHKLVRQCGADGYISKSDSGLEFARKVAEFLRLERTPAPELEPSKLS
jgi:DNA-binding response OmpR family regulator